MWTNILWWTDRQTDNLKKRHNDFYWIISPYHMSWFSFLTIKWPHLLFAIRAVAYEDTSGDHIYDKSSWCECGRGPPEGNLSYQPCPEFLHEGLTQWNPICAVFVIWYFFQLKIWKKLNHIFPCLLYTFYAIHRKLFTSEIEKAPYL